MIYGFFSFIRFLQLAHELRRLRSDFLIMKMYKVDQINVEVDDGSLAFGAFAASLVDVENLVAGFLA